MVCGWGRETGSTHWYDKFSGVEHIQKKAASKFRGGGGGICEGGGKGVRRVGITHPVEKGVGV